jgi:predicted RNA-binding Zn ribbon-like protein
MPTPAAAERAWVLPDEPLPVRLMSTVWADADGRHDDLRTTADVNAWLDAIGVDRAGAHATERELATARALRDAVRLLASYVTADARPGGPAAAAADVAAAAADVAAATADVAAAADQVNATAAELPAPRLALRDGRLGLGGPGGPSPVTTGLARVAEQAVGLLAGEDAARLRACYAPGCVLYFVKTHPRREWCSVACGNRVRAARHYQRARDRQGDA